MYGEGRQWRYLIGFGLIIVFLFIIIFMIARGGGGNNKVPETQRTLSSYANDNAATVTETIVGPIVADQEHSQVRISVTNQAATVEVLQGFNGTVVSSRSYNNNTASYREFLEALDRAGFTKGNTDKELANDQGFCPTGNRFIYTLTDGSTNVQRFWATSCGGTKTYRGSLGLTQTLFQRQIPDYSNIVNQANANLATNQLLL